MSTMNTPEVAVTITSAATTEVQKFMSAENVAPEVGGLPGDRHQSLARGLLVVGLDRVLEVAEQHVDGADHGGHLGGHPRVARVEEVDGPGRPGRDLPERSGGAHREGGEEVLGAA